MTMRKTLAGGLAAALVLTACGSQHPAASKHADPATHATPAAGTSSAPPFAGWSSVCQQVASDLQAAGYTYTGNGNWNITPGTITYGGLQALASKFAHLSYVETTGNGDAQTASDLGNAGTGLFHFLPAAVWQNSQYHHVMHEKASQAALNGWNSQYLDPVLNDCANGGG